LAEDPITLAFDHKDSQNGKLLESYFSTFITRQNRVFIPNRRWYVPEEFSYASSLFESRHSPTEI